MPLREERAVPPRGDDDFSLVHLAREETSFCIFREKELTANADACLKKNNSISCTRFLSRVYFLRGCASPSRQTNIK